jgi:pimeloyl-ACP methyl ester carboxylesterase
MPVELTSRTVEIAGMELDYLEAGAGPVLLFLHSGWGPKFKSSAYLTRLSQRFRVIAPFHPGFGLRARPEHFRDVGDLAYLYLDWFEQMKLENVLLIGASFGGWIALEIGVRCTHRLSGLVLSGPVGIKVGDRETRDYADFLAVDDQTRGALEFADPEFQTTEFTSSSDEDLLIAVRGREAEAHYGWKPFMHNPQLKQWLHRIDVPTLVLRGAADQIVAKHNHEAYPSLMPNARLAVVAHAGHHVHIDNPGGFAEEILGFVPADGLT